jgi:hypothetical protein
MKTKTIIRQALILAVVSVLSVSAGCRKDRNEEDTGSLQQLAKDEVAIESATGDVLNDANSVLSGASGKSVTIFPCNVTVDSSSIVGDTITYALTFNGLNCSGTHLREGHARIKKNVNTHWYEAGTTVKIYYDTLKITKISSGKYIILNGTKTFENVSGGLLIQLGDSLSSITHKITGTVQATFEDNTKRTWHISRQRTFTGTLGQLVVTEDGFGSADGYSNLVVWGTNRNDEAFYTQITQSVVFRQSCDWNPVSGIVAHQIPDYEKKATVTFGFNNSNEPITGTECPTRYKVDWEKGSHTGTIYLQLP